MALKRAGALWLKEKGGKKYFSGEIEIAGEKLRVFVYKNDQKKTDKHPDYNIMMPDDENEPMFPKPGQGNQEDPDNVPF